MTSPGARAVLYQTIWRDFHLVRGHGFVHHSFWITKEFCIQLIIFLQTLKYARPDKSNAMQRNLTLEKECKDRLSPINARIVNNFNARISHKFLSFPVLFL